MRLLYPCLFGLLIPYCSVAQYASLDSLCQVYRLPAGKDTITYVLFGTKTDLSKKKPLFLFRQGSTPRPIIDYNKGRYYLNTPFRCRDYKSDYHIAMVCKPGVSLVADSVFLAGFARAIQGDDPQRKYITATYQANNYRQRYVDDCNRVINYLVKQRFIDKRKVVFCGGSEGFTVGADLVANVNRHVTHTILFSGHTGRRFEQLVYATRRQTENGVLSAVAGKAQMETLYAYWADIVANPTSTTATLGDTYRAQFSFSEPTLPNLLKLKTPLYIAYGTADNEIAATMDYLPLDFIAHKKNNLTFRPYPDHDHQFFRLKKDDQGKLVSKEYNGDAVAKDWFEWLTKTPPLPH